MFQVVREIDFCYGHRLLNYQGKCAHLHGHNGRVVISLEGGDLDECGMLVDFGDIKKTINVWIDENLDHQMILAKDDPAVPVLQELGEPMFLMDENPTAENIARLIYEESVKLGLPVTEVRLWETPRCHAVYKEGDRE